MPEKPEAEKAQTKLRLAYSESAHPTADSELAEKKRRAAVADETPAQRNDKMIAALLRERAALQQQGKDDRIAQVDEQLTHYGHKPDGGKTAGRKQPPQGRSSKPQQTGDNPGA